MLTTRISIQVIGAFSQLLIIPLLPSSDYGLFIVIVSIAQLISPLAHWGLIVPMVTEAASVSAYRTTPLKLYSLFYGALWLIVSSIVLLLTFFVLSLELTQFSSNSLGQLNGLLPYFLLILILANAAELIASQLLVAKGEIWLSTLASGGTRYIAVTAILLFAISSPNIKIDLSYILLVSAIASALSLCFCLWSYFRAIDTDTRLLQKERPELTHCSTPTKTLFHSIFRRSNESLGAFLLAQIRSSAEVLMCSLVLGVNTAGSLAAARKFSNVVLMVSQTLNVAITPYSVKLIQQNNLHTLEKINRLICLTLLLLSGVVLGFTYFADLFSWFEKIESNYENILVYVVIMILALSIRFYFGSAMQILMNNGHQRVVLASYIWEIMAGFIIFLLAFFHKNAILVVAMLGISQAIQYRWLADQAKSKLKVNTRML